MRQLLVKTRCIQYNLINVNKLVVPIYNNYQITQKRDFISLDPFVNWFAESQKRNFVKQVLPLNIQKTFSESNEHHITDPKEIYLSHSYIEKLNKEFSDRADNKKLNGASSWVAFFGPSRCGMTVGVRKASLGVKGLAYVSLGHKSAQEDFNTFVCKQLQMNEVTKLEKLEPGDLRDAMTKAMDNLAKKDVYPIIILDDCESSLDPDGKNINEDMRQFLDLLLDLSDKITVYFLCNDVRFFRCIKQISELREHIEFRNWKYANYKESCQFLRECKLPITGSQLKSTATSFLGHDGDLSDYVAFMSSGLTHQKSFSKIINRGYLRLREVLLHPPNYCETQEEKIKFRVIVYSIFYLVHSNFYNYLVKDTDDINFPVNYKILTPVTKVHHDIITKIDSKITLDEVLHTLDSLMSNMYNITQSIELHADPFYGTGDLWVIWSSAKFQNGFELVQKDPLILALMKESKWDFDKFEAKRPKWDSSKYTLTYSGDLEKDKSVEDSPVDENSVEDSSVDNNSSDNNSDSKN